MKSFFRPLRGLLALGLAAAMLAPAAALAACFGGREP